MIIEIRPGPAHTGDRRGRKTMPTRHLGRLQLGAILGSALIGWGVIVVTVAEVVQVLN
jgi:hypothetical protein